LAAKRGGAYADPIDRGTSAVWGAIMKALFLGAFAASQAARISGYVETEIAFDILAEESDRSRLAAALAETEIVLSGTWPAGFPPAPRLRLLQVPLAGTDSIEIAALPSGVTLCNAYGHEPALGEFAIMAMLAWRHRFPEISTSFRAGSWRWSPLAGGPLRGEIAGQTVGIVGLGHIGREVAWRAAALGCRVLAANRTQRERPPCVERVYALSDLDRMLGECDVVVLSCALTPQTRGLIDANRLAAMQPRAFLINLARGPVADEDALFDALRDGAIGGAALDTWWRYPTAGEPEPRPSRHPFHQLPNVVMTPHCSPWTEGTVERRSRDVARNIDRFARGEPLENVVAVT
jgi:phosphoglycerate dehydrogenase-like enzyme